MFKRLITARQTSILSAAFVIASMVAASRILGLIRNRLLTARFTTEQLDPYWAAFRIPDFLFEILVAGAVSVAFIPVFTSYLSNNKKNEAFKIASSVINSASLTVVIFSAIYLLFASSILRQIVPGFSEEELKTAVSISRLLILFQVLPLVVGNFFTAILQSYRQFLVPALAPVIYNIGTIIGIIILSPLFGIYGPVYGVLFGACLFFAIHVPLIWHVGYRHMFILNLRHRGVKEIGRLMIPRTISVSATQLDFTVDTYLASLLGGGSITILTLARQLQIIPVMLFGLPIAQAALPTFTDYIARGSIDRFKSTLITSLHQILFFVFPASALLVVLKVPIVRLALGGEQFDWPDTVLTARSLAAFGVSLFAQAIIVLLIRAFFALKDSKTPVVISVISVLLNSILSIVFIQVLKMPIWGLGISASIATLLHALALLILLDRKVGYFDRAHLIIPFIKISVTTLIMAVPLYVLMKLFDQLVFDTTRTIELVLLTITVSSIGLATYLFFAWFFNIEEVVMFYKFAQKLTRFKDILVEPSQEVGSQKMT
ncbi:MAG: putative peptidoglycan lipid II flippase MurJ [Candidatus Roizmanbacteria bacterium GW2011_GWB1_40_7]|uniref:Probable lipid II flippase MurJ n=1 Tax=Candidatus Roizmanbacteria bacterium GW2011_GWB1_40_7 TaxID=1618482 RepID=A0A0G0T3Q3_9BACT|nr:MAG: putative peptidoglycan lipid II flippase MurJ [Candidatus Levybacteria bacterium GW2011_GWA2_40_16]KKR71609.1 MAG: putative peptidoglycan lipid II flippase MurJ [Candidatus Roizmanbacteria bacterium GW2011_GWB1_40_7]